jgi:hypothetical protein
VAKQVDVIVVVPDQVPDPDRALVWSRAVAGNPGRLVDESWIVPIR